MLNCNLVVPIILPTRSLHFAEILENGSAQDVIDTLLQIEGLTMEVLGDLEDSGWALQKIRAEECGRAWEEDELTTLGDGTIQMDALLIFNQHNSKSEAHFSSFPMTNHLHNPAFRLVSLHPLLSISVSFLRVPEIPDEFKYKIFISRTMTVADVLDSIINELGLTKSSPIPGGGNLDYVLEEVWIDGANERVSRLPITSVAFNFTGFPFSPNPFKSTAQRNFRICVPSKWYRRTKPRGIQSATAPSDSTLRRLAEMESDEEDGEGTAKIGGKTVLPACQNSAKDIEQRGLVTQGRLSSLFEGWTSHSPTSPTNYNSTSFTPDNGKSVSEPRLVDRAFFSHLGRNNISDTNTMDEESLDFSETAYEEMLDELGLKGDKRSAMYSMSDDQKKYLLRQFRPNQLTLLTGDRSSAASYGPSSATALLPRLVPQLTGDEGLMRRISIFGWGFGGSAATSPAGPPSPNGTPNSPGPSQALVNNPPEDIQPLQPQTTGSSWRNWWISSGGEKNIPLEKGGLDSAKSAKWYIDTLRSGKAPDLKLVKHLITLRVHLSTANLAFIQDFVRNEKGVDMLGKLLAGLVGKGGKRRRLTEIESTVFLEVFKCLRALLNTEGFNEVLLSRTLITYISYALYTSFLKVHALASELLAVICVMDVFEGHKAVLAAFSDSRIAYDEEFRFETLLTALRLPDVNTDSDCDGSIIGFGNEEEGVLDARVATMTLINALTNSSDNLEERVSLREEFSRRGLNELIVALRYIEPPDSLLTLLDLYVEEKVEDEQDMQERARTSRNQISRGHERSLSDSEVVLQDLIQLAKQHGDLYPIMIDTLKRYGQIFQRDIELHMKVDLLTILDRFVEQAAMLNNFDESWHVFLKRFAASVQHITGQEIEVKEARENASINIMEQELELLRAKVDELTDERKELRNELSHQLAEFNTLKTLPLGVPVHNPSNVRKPGPEQNVHGLVQRLVQREKEVLQLRTELDRFKAQNPGDGMEADERAKRERDRIKWNTLMEEITKHKTKNSELESSLNIKQKEVIYLKRALESVYTRFSLREVAREEMKDAEMDAEQIAKCAIERLAQKDEQIVALSNEISELKARLLARPKTEQEFKAKSPPPPPPVKNRKLPPSIEASSPPPPPPPPPPPLSSSLSHSLSGSLAAPPPPPSTGLLGIPPPPPPPPSAFRLGPNLKATRPAKKLKPFFWNKTNNRVNTIWSDLPAPIQVDFSDLESMFILDNIPSTPSKIVSKKKQSITTLLDITRANNVAIMLSRIKMGYPEIRLALMEIDDEKLTIDELKAISKQLPTVEEAGRIKSFDDVNKLAKADQYFYQIMTIPRLSERLQCMQYRRRLELEIEEIRPDLNFLRNASRELRSSMKFKQILQIVLALGNTLNGSTSRGGAQGFQLNSLLKMNETKTARASPDCPTLLHYLARVLLRKDPSLTTFIYELPSLEAATHISMQITVQTVTTLVTGLTQVKNEIQRHRKLQDTSLNDRFVQVMESFIAHVSPNVDALMNMGNMIQEELRSLLIYYGENPDSSDAPKPDDLFGLVATFSSSLQKCAFEIRDAEMKKPLSEVVEIWPENIVDPTIKKISNSTVTQKGSQGYAVGNHSVGRGSYDQAIRTIGRRNRPARPLSRIFLDGAGHG